MSNIDDIFDRLKSYYKVNKDRELSDKMGVKANTFKTWRERSSVPYKKLHELSQIETFSLDWVLDGKGNMLLNDKKLPVAQEQPLEDDENTVALNYYPDIVAAAGYGALNNDMQHAQIMKFDRRFLEEFLNVRKFDKIDIIKITGDSMEPYIHDGETVLVERHSDARNGETVIANVNGHIYVKRFHTHPFGKWIKLVSENESYSDIDLEGSDLEHFNIVGIVRARIKAF